MAHAPARDEIIKNTFANFAFEHFEIAAYKSLLNLADLTGHSAAITARRQPLGEEQAMAQWIDDHFAETTRTFVLRSEAGEPAGH
jgi:ferritin-like metal-binding protein YciE